MDGVKSCIDTFHSFQVEKHFVEVAPFHVGFDREQDAGAGLGVGRIARCGVKSHTQCADDLENGGEARVSLAG